MNPPLSSRSLQQPQRLPYTAPRWPLPRYRAPRILPNLLLGIFLILFAVRLYQTTSPPDESPRQADVIYDLPARFVQVKRVVDGDTLLLESGERVRLLGVNTPEIANRSRPAEWLGDDATEFTRQTLEGRTVRLEFDRERFDIYGRTLAYVYADDLFLNEEIILAGFSAAHNQFPFRSDMKRKFSQAELQAKSRRVGRWQEPATSQK